jgi:hypothetical protein
MDRLQYLYLDHNELTTLEADLFFWTRIEMLDLRFNLLTGFPNNTFNSMMFAKVVHLSHNPLKVLKKGLLVGMPFLDSVYIEHSHLKEVQSGAFPESVRKISIQYASHLENIANGTFSNLPNLREVAIENNPELRMIEAGAFGGRRSSVQTVFLRSNSLWTISDELLNWTQVTKADLTGNNLDCDCHILWMRQQIPEEAFKRLQ